MSDDMANELRREAAVLAATMPHLDVSLVVEAADRIEALEAERDSLATTIDGWVDKVHALEAELERIHAVMAEVDDEVDPLDAELADAHAIESDLRAELAAERALADRLARVLCRLDTDNFLHLADGHDTLHDQHGEQVYWTGGDGVAVLLISAEVDDSAQHASPLDDIDAALATHRAARTKDPQ